ncbi:MAG: PKD-like domain-containing protein, partial [Sediminibacterium sp.]
MTTPSTTVCSGVDFPISIQSSSRIWVTLDISTDNGNTWSNGNIFYTTSLSSGLYQRTFTGNNINVTTRFRLRYSLSSDNSNPQTYEPAGGLIVNLYTTPNIQPATITRCANSEFSYMPANGGGNIVPVGTTYTWTYTATASVTGATSNTNSGTTSITQNILNGTNTQTTIVYDVLATSAEGCPAINTFSLTVLLNPAPQISNNNDQVCSGSNY